jgi:hypothetical protein
MVELNRRNDKIFFRLEGLLVLALSTCRRSAFPLRAILGNATNTSGAMVITVRFAIQQIYKVNSVLHTSKAC